MQATDYGSGLARKFALVRVDRDKSRMAVDKCVGAKLSSAVDNASQILSPCIHRKAFNIMLDHELPPHPAIVTFRQVQECKAWPEIPELTATADLSASWRRVLSFLALMDELIESTPHSLTSTYGLNQLKAYFDQLLEQLNQFRNQKNGAYLANALSTIDAQIFPSLWAFAPTRNLKSFPRRAVEDISAHSGKVIAQLTAANAAAAAELDALRAEIADSRREIAATKKKIDAEQARVGAVADEGRARIANEANAIRTAFEVQQKSIGEANSAILETSQVAFDKFKSETESAARALLSQMESKHSQVATLLGLTADKAVTDNYQTTASTEGRQANKWRWITLAVFGAAACLGAWALYELAEKKITWDVALIRVIFGALVAMVAFYTGNESARHRINSDRAKRVELELASLGPFLEEMPKEKREEIRQKLAEKYFANEVTDHQVGTAVPAKDLLALTEKAVDTIGKFSKH